MARTYISKKGDTVDLICWRIFGKTAGMVEQTFALNPQISVMPTELDAGIEIILPEENETPEADKIKLWD